MTYHYFFSVLAAFMGRTLFDKLWDRHVIGADETGEVLLYIDRVSMHERTGSIAMQSLSERGLKVRRPDHAICVMDHTVDTFPGRGDKTPAAGGEAFILSARGHASEFGLRLFDVNDENQGISHLVNAEQGFALPGLTLICPDSHTCTLGALGALAFGVGASQVEHALATSSLHPTKPKSMRVTFEGARMTLCNMAVEFSAFTGLIAPDTKTFEYLEGRPYAPAPPPSKGRVERLDKR